MEKQPDPAAEFGSRLNHHIEADALAETIYLGLFAVRTNTWTGETEPDWRTRSDFAKLAVAYKVGKPLERKEETIITHDMTLDEMREKAKGSAAYRDAVIETLKAIIKDSEQSMLDNPPD